MANEDLSTYYMDFDPNNHSNDFEYIADDYDSFECFKENTDDEQHQTSSFESMENETNTANEDSIIGRKVNVHVQRKLPLISVDGEGNVLQVRQGVTPKLFSQCKYYFFFIQLHFEYNFSRKFIINSIISSNCGYVFPR